MPRFTKLNWQEPTAYVCAAVAIGVGLYAGIKCDPAWLSRAGSVVIVCGVLLAASRKIELLHAKAAELIDEHSDKEFDALLAQHQKPNSSPITEEQAKKIRKQTYDIVNNKITTLIEERRRIFKLHELAIVIAGTLINGFGEWAIKVIQSHAT